MSDDEVRHPVILCGVPLVEGQGVLMFRNDMIRELQLIELGRSMESVGPSDLDPVAAMLRADMEWLRDEFSGHFRAIVPVADPDRDPDAKVGPPADSDVTVDYVAELRLDAANRIERVVGHVEDLNWFSTNGQLLTVGASPVVMDLVRWLRDEAVGQLVDGRAPRPFVRRAG